MIKLSLQKTPPEKIYLTKAEKGVCSLLLACLPDGALAATYFLKSGSKAEVDTHIAHLQKKWPQAEITNAPKGFKPDTTRGVLAGTPFQLKVWQKLAKQKPGTTTSYSALAEATGHPAATRAVGTAVGRNPLAPYIPCHLVLAKDGGLGGFSGGLPLKKKLLAQEGIAI